MTVELGARLTLLHAGAAMNPKDLRDRLGHQGLDPVVTLDRASFTPSFEKLISFFQRTNLAQTLSDFVRIKNAGCVGMRVEMNERVFLVEIEMLRQPIKRAGVIVFDVDREINRPAIRRPRCCE